MATYTWELGIDWDATTGAANASYLSCGFVEQGVIKRPHVKNLDNSDTITFLIFDVTKNSPVDPKVTHIESFTINSQAAVSQPSTDPLSTLQPRIPNPNSQPTQSFYFNDTLPCWISEPVAVTEVADATEKKFLLNFFVQARGPNGSGPRTFAHDPEMIVGPNGG